MSLQKKLDKAFVDGFAAGVNSAFDILDNAMDEVEGIGPKTMAKLKQAIEDKATEYYKNQDPVV